MSSLKAFLNPIQVENKEVIVSNRFQEDGKPVPFVIKPISEKENEQLLRKHTKKDKRPARKCWIEQHIHMPWLRRLWCILI